MSDAHFIGLGSGIFVNGNTYWEATLGRLIPCRICRQLVRCYCVGEQTVCIECAPVAAMYLDGFYLIQLKANGC